MAVMILYTPTFIKSLKKVPKREFAEIKKREKIFVKDPFDPRLNTHKLKGELSDYWSFSITYSFRIVFRFVKGNKVLFVDVGSHDIYK